MTQSQCGSHSLSCFDSSWVLVSRCRSMTALLRCLNSVNTLTTFTTQIGCFPSWCNCNLTSYFLQLSALHTDHSCLLELAGCCGNSCCLPQSAVSPRTGSHWSMRSSQCVTYLTAHPLQSPSISLKFHSPMGLLSRKVSPMQPVKVVTLTASDFCNRKHKSQQNSI